MERSGEQIVSGEDIGRDAFFLRAAWPGFGFVGRCPAEFVIICGQ